MLCANERISFSHLIFGSQWTNGLSELPSQLSPADGQAQRMMQTTKIITWKKTGIDTSFLVTPRAHAFHIKHHNLSSKGKWEDASFLLQLQTNLENSQDILKAALPVATLHSFSTSWSLKRSLDWNYILNETPGLSLYTQWNSY